MTHQHATLGDTVYLGFVSNDTSGSAVDGTTPLFDVRLGGALASAAPVLSGTPDLLTHASFGPGCYEVAVAATSGNGFAAGNTYLVYVTVTADSQTPGAFVGSFTLTPLATSAALATAQTDLDTLTGADGATLATSQPNYAPAVAGDNMGTVSAVTGGINTAAGTITTLDGLDTAQDTQHGTTQSAIATAQADLDLLTGADGATLATSQPNYAPATAAALATVDTIADNLVLGMIFGSAATGTLSTTQATSNLTGYADDQLIGRIITFTSGACDGESSDITDYANTGGLLTFTALTTAPANGDTFKIT